MFSKKKKKTLALCSLHFTSKIIGKTKFPFFIVITQTITLYSLNNDDQLVFSLSYTWAFGSWWINLTWYPVMIKKQNENKFQWLRKLSKWLWRLLACH